MSLKKSIRKLIAAFVAMLMLHSNFYMFGLGLSKVIAQDIKEPSIILSLENTQYVQFKEEIEKTEEELETTEPETEAVEENDEQDEKEYNSGVAIKTKLQLGLEEQETQLPIKGSEVVVSMPVLNGHLPERATVVRSNTALTNGESNIEKINQSYDSTSGLLTVSYSNEEAYLNYNKESKDEFEIIYIYPEQAYQGNEEEISLQYSVSAKVNFETEEVETFSELLQGFEIKEKDNKGSLLTFETTKSDIYKGFMYSNVENGTEYNTDYNTVSTLCVLNNNISEQLTMVMEENKFVLNDEEKTEISAEGRVVYKSTQINKAEFDRIFGQDGVLEIYEEETLLATVKYIEVTENEELIKRLAVIYSEENIKTLSTEELIAEVEYAEGVKSLMIKATKPLTEGYMNFKNENTIKAAEDYLVDVSELKTIKTTATANENIENIELSLLEPETKISVNSSNLSFSTLQTSKTTLTINLDSTNASTKLFDSPTISVKLPNGLTGGRLTSYDIVNGNGLKIKGAHTDKHTNAIVIELEGNQTSYDLTNVSGGASIVMDIEDIDFADTIPTHGDKIQVTCVQGKEKIEVNCNVNIVSKAGLLMLTEVTDSVGNIIEKTIENGIKEIQISDNDEKRELVKKISLVNNYETDLEDLQIIGRIGYNDSELKTTFNAILTRNIHVNQSGAKVYYSLKEDATYEDESWTEECLKEAKSYKIVLNNNKMLKKECIIVSVPIELMEKIGYNQVMVLNTEVNYTFNNQTQKEISTIKMLTPKVEEKVNTVNDYEDIQNLDLDIGTTVTVGGQKLEEGDSVKEGQILRYTIALKNNGNNEITNLKVNSQIENAVYYELAVIGDASGKPATGYVEKTPDDLVRSKVINIPANDIVLIEYQVVVKEDVEKVNNSIKVEKEDKVIYEKQISNDVTQAKLKLKVKSEFNEELSIMSGSRLGFIIEVTNITDKDLKNIKVSCELPEELDYNLDNLNSYFWGEYEKNGFDKINKTENTLYWTINKLGVGQKKEIIVRPDVKELAQEIVKKDLMIIATAIEDEDTYKSNDLIKTIYQSKSDLDATLNISVEKEDILKLGDQIVFNVNLKNEGSLNLEKTVIEMFTSTGLTFNKYKNKKTGEEVEINNEKMVAINNIKLMSKEENEYIIYATVNEHSVGLNSISITGSVFDDLGKDISFEELTYKLENNEKDIEREESKSDVGDVPPEDIPEKDIPKAPAGQEPSGKPTDPETPGENQPADPNKPTDSETPGEDKPAEQEKPEQSEEQLYIVSGLVWLDENKDGKRDEKEPLQSNIVVSLVDMNKGDFALDKNGNVIKTTTDSEGKYIFNNIAKGTYAVLFEFDTNRYTVATYQKEGVDKAINSDVILSTVNINGVNKKAGLTDKIELTSNTENIDMGIIENATFDLSLNKEITKITVVDKQGTQEYEYKDGHTAKVDLVAKYMNGANVIVNYRFTIKNNGDVTGYVDSLVDSLPSGLEFSSELNKDWYKGSDGRLYTTSLSGIAIKPGNSITVDLVLTKSMTEENAGTFVNNAELEKISNLENINEKEEKVENNVSSAILIISIKTGSAILYIGITVICLAIIGLGVYFIKKKVLNKVI